VAIVTSPTGAAREDMLAIIRARNSAANVRLFPSLVQGDGAARMMANCLAYISESFADTDVVIIGRGGGSAEDLQAFNEEVLADAIYAMDIPIISGVGHETDFTIADFTADARAETPTAAAHMAVPDTFALSLSVDALSSDMQTSISGVLAAARRSVPDERSLIERLKARLTLAALRLERSSLTATSGAIRTRVDASERRTAGLASGMHREVRRSLEHLEFAAAMQETALAKLNPLSVLSRGYSIIQDENGRAVSAAAALREGDRVKATFKDGSVAMEVRED
jgi:exodeoxyribonuclease VII large subunit